MDAFLKDFRLGLRALFKRPASSVIAIIAFGLGIGLCTTNFSMIYGVYFRGIGVPESDRLTLIFRTNPSENIDRMSVDQHDFYDWRDQQQSFEALAGYYNGTVNVSGIGDDPIRFDGAFVTANLFEVLRKPPIVGTGFREGDDAPDAPLTAILGYDVWASRYESDPNVVGQLIRVNGEQATILGVMPENFRFPEQEDIWVAYRDSRLQNPERGTGQFFTVVGRLRDGTSVEQATLDMSLIAQNIADQYPESNEGVGVRLGTFVEESIGPEAWPVFVAMQIATIFVLLIACANVANLLLARAALRTKEAAVRSALGASRWRVALPLLTESAALAVVGALLGILIAFVGVEIIDRTTVGVGRPYYMIMAVDLPILGFVAAITALTALAAGAAPAIQTARTDVNTILKDENRGSSSFRGSKLSKLLIVGEVALSCALLVGAGLMTKSITKLNNYEFQFDTERIFSARIGVFEADYPTVADRQRFFRDLKERLQSIPGARSVALTDMLPSTCCNRNRIGIEGAEYQEDQDYPIVNVAAITPDFFATFGIAVISGRDFSLSDDADAAEVAIVNQGFADRFFPGEDPLGRRFRTGTSESQEEWLTIVGVAPNLQMEGFDPDRTDPSGFYRPLAQQDRRFMSIAIQVPGGPPLNVAPEVRAAVRAINRDLPIYWVRDMEEVIYQETWIYGFFGSLFIIFGVAALFLASVGLYGVLSFSVSRRFQEMGLRMALGAKARDVIRLVVREGAVQLAIGLAIGLTLALGVSRVAALIMFEVEPRDPAVFSVIVITILAVGLIASLVPAMRATRVAPGVALRYE